MQNGRRPSDRFAGLWSGRSSRHLSVRLPAVCFPISKPNPGPPTARQLGSRRGPVAKRSGRHVRKATFRVVDRRAVGEIPTTSVRRRISLLSFLGILDQLCRQINPNSRHGCGGRSCRIASLRVDSGPLHPISRVRARPLPTLVMIGCNHSGRLIRLEGTDSPNNTYITEAAMTSRCVSVLPNSSVSLLARRKYLCRGCSQVNPMPPWIWMDSSVA